MNQQFIVSLFKNMILTVLSLAGPMLFAGLITGLLVSIFQSVTQLKDQTLTFVPKIVAVAATLVLFLPWMMNTLISFTTNLFLSVGNVIQ